MARVLALFDIFHSLDAVKLYAFFSANVQILSGMVQMDEMACFGARIMYRDVNGACGL